MNTKSKIGWVAVILISLIAGAGFADDNAEEVFSMEPLRDPFWPVGYFPKDWQADNPEEEKQLMTSGSDWDGPAALLHVSGTSQMGAKTVALINGDLKEVGDSVEVSYGGRIYQWKLKEVKASGKVRLERVDISAGAIGFHPGDKK